MHVIRIRLFMRGPSAPTAIIVSNAARADAVCASKGILRITRLHCVAALHMDNI